MDDHYEVTDEERKEAQFELEYEADTPLSKKGKQMAIKTG